MSGKVIRWLHNDSFGCAKRTALNQKWFKAVLLCWIFFSILSVGNPVLDYIYIRTVSSVCRCIFSDCQISSFNQIFLMLPESVLAHIQILADFAHLGKDCVPGPDACGKVRIDRLRLDRQLPVTHHACMNRSIAHRKYINHLCCHIHYFPCFPFLCFDRTADILKMNRCLGLCF